MLARIAQFPKNRFLQWRLNKRIEDAHTASFESENQRICAIHSILCDFHQQDGLKHRFQAYKLLALFKLLDKYKPTSILEFGTGSTTKAFFHYLSDNKLACLHSVEENQHWLDVIKKDPLLEQLRDRATTNLSKREFVDGEVTEFRYSNVPNLDPDFIFVDGPSHLLAGHNVKNAVDTNAIDFVKRGKRPVIVVSARMATAKYLQTTLVDYVVVESDLLKQRYFKDYNYFTIFIPQNKNSR